MIPLSQLQMEWYQILLLILITLFVFTFTFWLYPYIISWMKRKGYVGYDIHKKDRPETAESGGIGFSITIIIGFTLISLVFPIFWHELFIFNLTIAIATIVGWIDDRKQLSSLKKLF